MKGVRGTTPPCLVDTCQRPAHSYGYCTLHWRRLQKHGDPTWGGRGDPTLPCRIDGCQNRHRCQGLCDKHYTRLLRHGDPLTALVIHGDDERRFWQYVDKTETCWLWSGSQYSTGYGLFTVGVGDGDRYTQHAHRFAYESLVGPIPESLQLDHLCRMRLCVRAPDHLEPVTARENMRRAAAARKVIDLRPNPEGGR